MNLKTLPLFFYIGCIGFGGWASVFTILQNEFVSKRKLISDDDLTDIMTYSKILPGSTAVHLVSALSYRLGGVSYSALATVLFIFPAFLIMLCFSVLYKRVSNLTYIQYAIQAINAGVIGILFVTTFQLFKKSVSNIISFLIVLMVFVLVAFVHVPLVIVVLATGIYGLMGRKGSKIEGAR